MSCVHHINAIQIWHQCQVFGHSAKGTVHTVANCHLPGACRPLSVLMKACSMDQGYSPTVERTSGSVLISWSRVSASPEVGANCVHQSNTDSYLAM